MSYTLSSAEQLHRDFPDTFHLPQGRTTLRAGDHAKLIFDEAERMWVLVTKRIAIDEKVIYHGTLANNPAVCKLQFGDEVVFEPKHVIAVQLSDDDE